MKKIILLFALTTSLLTLSAQPSGIYSIGTAYPSTGISLVQSKDSGIALCGYTYYGGVENLYIAKMNTSGNLLWTTFIKGSYNQYGYSIANTYNGGFIAAGITSSYGVGSFDFYVIRFDSAGQVKWSKTIGGIDDDEAFSIIQSKDSGYVVCGYTTSFGAGKEDVYVVKLNKRGQLIWDKTIGGSKSDYGFSIIQTLDSGFAIAGMTNSYGAGRVDDYLVKLDKSGNLQWTKTIGGPNADYANSLIQTHDKGYALAGQTKSFHDTNGDCYLVKLDSAGNLQWAKSYGGRRQDQASQVIETNDGYLMSGNTYSYGDTVFGSVYIVKTDLKGNLKWTKTISGGPYMNFADNIIRLRNSGYALAGGANAYNQDMYLLVLDSNFNTCDTDLTGCVVDSGGIVSSGGMEGTGGVIDSGFAAGTGGILKVVCGILGEENINNILPIVSLYPNPSTGKLTLQISNSEHRIMNIEVYNVLGVKVYSHSPTGGPTFKIDLSSQPNGIYLYRVLKEDGSLIGSGKFVVE